MNQKEAMLLVNNTLFGLQRLRSMTVEELTRMGWEEETVKRVISDLIPWMHGEKGDAFLNALAKVSSRGTVTGAELYNFMAILHLLDRNLLMMLSGASGVMFPEPKIEWIPGLGM